LVLKQSSSPLASRVFLGRTRLELESHDRFVADDPGIVSGFDDVGLTWTDLLLCAVLVDDAHRARLQQAEMERLTPLASDDRLDALRPSPSRLQPHARCSRSTHPTDLA